MSNSPWWRPARLVALDKEIEPAEFTAVRGRFP